MATRKSIPLGKVIEYCLESDIDSSTGGLTSDEEEEIDKELMQSGNSTEYVSDDGYSEPDLEVLSDTNTTVFTGQQQINYKTPNLPHNHQHPPHQIKVQN